MSFCPVCLCFVDTCRSECRRWHLLCTHCRTQPAGCKEGCTREECLKGPTWHGRWLGRQAGVLSRLGRVGFTHCDCEAAAEASTNLLSLFDCGAAQRDALVGELLLCDEPSYWVRLGNCGNSPHIMKYGAHMTFEKCQLP